MTEYQKNAFAALLANILEAQQWCADHAELLTEQELRTHIARTNRAYGLPPALLERIARIVETEVGVSMTIA